MQIHFNVLYFISYIYTKTVLVVHKVERVILAKKYKKQCFLKDNNITIQNCAKMDATLELLNSVVVEERVKFRDLPDGDYYLKNVTLKNCQLNNRSWRAAYVVAANESGKVFSFFLPSNYFSRFSDDVVTQLNNSKIVLRKDGVATTWSKEG